jgi:hypothetical protein
MSSPVGYRCRASHQRPFLKPVLIDRREDDREFSAVSWGRLLIVADPARVDAATVHHVSEALLFRQLDAEGLDTAVHGAPFSRLHETRAGVH